MLLKLSAGPKAPEIVHAVIEIPVEQNSIKYEIDKSTGAVFVNRFLRTSLQYPCNYGYIPQTLADDGDPLDILVITPYPMVVGCVILARPIGMLKMSDEAGEDGKILAVPIPEVCHLYDDITEYDQLPKDLLRKIEYFFIHYKDLEPNKWSKSEGWDNKAAAEQLIMQAMQQYVK